jgi:hypothetical protein
MTPTTYWADKLFKSEAMDELVRLDLTDSYESAYNEKDWKLRDALRQVIKYYSNADQYKEFMRTSDESNEDS